MQARARLVEWTLHLSAITTVVKEDGRSLGAGATAVVSHLTRAES